MCGFPELGEPAYGSGGEPSFEICPCCQVEFGLTDDGVPHGLLRELWVADDLRWRGLKQYQPVNWSGEDQLHQSGLVWSGTLDREQLLSIFPEVAKLWDSYLHRWRIGGGHVEHLDAYIKYCSLLAVLRDENRLKKIQASYNHFVSLTSSEVPDIGILTRESTNLSRDLLML